MELSQKEVQRIKVIENAVEGRITVRKAAELLNLSERQVKRLKGRYQANSVDWVRHGNVGRKRKWGLKRGVRRQIEKLARSRYAGFNDTHLSEKLVEQEGIEVSRETVRRVLRAARIASPQKRRAKKYRARRERRPRLGEMVLADASRHDWLEGRGPAMTLLGFQDDATGRMLAGRFQLEYEDTWGYLRRLREMVERYGIPISLYRDRHGTFQRNDGHWTVEEQLAGRQTPTQLGRALEELGIQQIAALSPQAKGRIERVWRVFQDRLISELRLAKAHNLEQANGVLEKFIEQYNTRFGKPPREAASDFRPAPKKLNLDRILSLRYQRTVINDHVVSLGARSVQLPPLPGKRGYAGATVELSHQPNGELHVWLGDQHIHQMALPTEYTIGQAPRRPAARKGKQPRIYNFAGRPALAVR
jgi:transposase